jgi:long-chain acyl-CoA synthetase
MTQSAVSSTPASVRVSTLQPIDYRNAQSVPEVLARCAQRSDISGILALHDPHAKPEIKLSYGELDVQVKKFAVGMQSLGVQAGDRIALISDNSPRWLVADLGIMTAGAVDVVRSSQADRDEVVFILGNSGSTGLVVQDKDTLARLRKEMSDLPIRFAILLSDETPDADDSLKVMSYAQFIDLGDSGALVIPPITPDSLATLLYTSGTTGRPKGVMLTHGNLLHQINTVWEIVQPQPGDRVLSILPTWHAYERTCEYFLLSQGCSQVYTNLRNVKQDLKKYKPNFMVGVPRLWESIYEGIQRNFREQPPNKQKLVNFLLDNSRHYIEARRIVQGLCLGNMNPSSGEKLKARLEMTYRWPGHRLAHKLVYGKVKEATGGCIKQVISGGGALATHLDTFFEVIGLEVLVGYGLTETAPVLTARKPSANLRGSAGQPLSYTEIKIVDPETRAMLPKGQRGLVMARGPQVMKGYYQNPEATQKAIDPEGWFDTGDLGMIVGDGFLVLTGRAKDTIVLTNGENIEPQPIEDACLRSPFIDQMMLVGQDERSLGALIVPNQEALEHWATAQKVEIHNPDGSIDLNSKVLQDLFRKELNREVKDRPGYRPDDRIGPFRLLEEGFTMDNGLLTQTLKVRRNVVMDRYRSMIVEMFA